MANIRSFQGVVTRLDNFGGGEKGQQGCTQLLTVEDRQGMILNFIVDQETYIVERPGVRVGDQVTGFYDGDAPAVLIYPAQYRALVLAVDSPGRQVAVASFDRQFVSSDGRLQLTITPYTPVLLRNGQQFIGSLVSLTNRLLLVVYGQATKSIPAQTSPSKIIVMC